MLILRKSVKHVFTMGTAKAYGILGEKYNPYPAYSGSALPLYASKSEYESESEANGCEINSLP